MIRIRVGALHEADAEAILRPVSADLAPVTGAGRDVELRLGDSVRDRLASLGGLPLGGAAVTPGGETGVPFLIHVVVQSADEAVSAQGVRKALLNGLRRASEWEIETLALPPLGTGAGNLEPEDSARVMLPLLVEHLELHPELRELIVTVPNAYEEEVFVRELERARRSAAAGNEEPGAEGPESAGGATAARDQPVPEPRT